MSKILGICLALFAMGCTQDAASQGGGYPTSPNFLSVTINQLSIYPPIMCTTACNVSAISVGQSAYIYKGSPSTRNSTTTDTADTDIQFTSVPLGVYQIDLYLTFSAGASQGGWKFKFNPSSTVFITSGVQNCSGLAVASVVVPVNVDLTCANTGTGNSPTFLHGVAGASANDTFALLWSQNSSNANSSTLLGGLTYAVITRIN